VKGEDMTDEQSTPRTGAIKTGSRVVVTDAPDVQHWHLVTNGDVGTLLGLAANGGRAIIRVDRSGAEVAVPPSSVILATAMAGCFRGSMGAQKGRD